MHIDIYTYIYAYLHIWACLKIWTGYCFFAFKNCHLKVYYAFNHTNVCLYVCMHACIDRSWSWNPDGIMDRIMSSMWFNVCGGFGSHWPHKLQTVSKVCSTLTSSSCSRTCCSRVRIISWGATSTAEECSKYSWRIILACVKLDSMESRPQGGSKNARSNDTIPATSHQAGQLGRQIHSANPGVQCPSCVPRHACQS